MRIYLFAGACAASLVLAACSSAAPSRVAPSFMGIQLEPETPIGYDGERPSNLTVDVIAFLRSELDDTPCPRLSPRRERHAAVRAAQREFSCLLGVLERQDEARRQRVRNSLATQLVHASNVNCRTFLWSLRGTQVGSRLASDIFTSGFTLAGSLHQNPRTAQIFSGLGSLTSASGASIDRAVFAQAGVEIITEQVIAMRRDGRTRIEQNLQKSYTVYPLGLALADIADYHLDCSVVRGLSRMQEELHRREEAVRVSRQTALRVMESGGSAAAVAAAVGGVADVYLRLDSDSATPADLLSPQHLNNAPLLDRSRNEVLDLMPLAETTGLDGVKTALEAHIRQNTDPGENSTLEGPPTPPQHLRFAIAARDILSAFGDATYAVRRREAVTRMAQIREEIIGVRVTAAEQVRRLGEAGADFATVAAAIRGMRGPDDGPFRNDPVLTAMAQSIPGGSDPALTGPQLATRAIASAIAVIVSEEAEERRRQTDGGS